MTDVQRHKIEMMQVGGRYAAELRGQLLEMLEPGLQTNSLEKSARRYFEQHSLVPSFLGYQGYPYTIVVCINEEVVHGMPSQREIQAGDVVTVDLGVRYQEYHTDTAATVEVQTNRQQKFLNIGKEALQQAINQCRAGNHVGDISYAMQTVIERHGYQVIRAFVGHEIGKEMHEELQIPCFGEPGEGPQLQAGMTLAVEVMYTQGSFHLQIKDDGWTAVTRDNSLSAMFEHTIAITDGPPLILT